MATFTQQVYDIINHDTSKLRMATDKQLKVVETTTRWMVCAQGHRLNIMRTGQFMFDWQDPGRPVQTVLRYPCHLWWSWVIMVSESMLLHTLRCSTQRASYGLKVWPKAGQICFTITLLHVHMHTHHNLSHKWSYCFLLVDNLNLLYMEHVYIIRNV